MPTEFEVNGKNYRADKMDAIKQLHLVRKIGPIIAKIAPNFSGPQGMESSGTDPVPLPGAQSLSDVIKLIEPVLDAIHDMDDADVNYILKLTGSVTSREEAPGKWIPIWNQRAGMLQFQDITLQALVQIILTSIQENVGDFLGGSPLPSTGLALGQRA